MNTETQEEIIDPLREIIDCHHHLWNRPDSRYMVDEFLRDAQDGHHVVQSIFIQCRTGYRHGTLDSPALETTAIAHATHASQGQASPVQVGAGIVGYADMRGGAGIAPLLDAHIQSGGDRFKGVRHIVAWADGPEFQVEGYPTAPGMMSSPEFEAALQQLAVRNLSFEAMVYHTQLDELAGVARTHADTRFVLNHIGLPLGIGAFSSRKEHAFADWRAGLRALAGCDNVYIKLGGMGMHMLGLALDSEPGPFASKRIADAYRPYVDECVSAVGANRCMFESNFPVDRRRCDYRTLWNAFKRIGSSYTEDEKHMLFSDTARRCYGLE